MSISEKQVFDRFVNILTEAETLKQDLKAFKGDVTFHKDHNPGGYSKDTIKTILKAAQLEVKMNFEEFSAESAAVRSKYVELTGYEG